MFTLPPTPKSLKILPRNLDHQDIQEYAETSLAWWMEHWPAD